MVVLVCLLPVVQIYCLQWTRLQHRAELLVITPNWIISGDILTMKWGDLETRYGDFRKCLLGHFRVAFCLCVKTSLSAKPFIWKCVSRTGSFSYKSNSFLYQRFCMWTRFETEAQGYSEMPITTVSWKVNQTGTTDEITDWRIVFFFNSHLLTTDQPRLNTPSTQASPSSPSQRERNSCVSHGNLSSFKFNERAQD